MYIGGQVLREKESLGRARQDLRRAISICESSRSVNLDRRYPLTNTTSGVKFSKKFNHAVQDGKLESFSSFGRKLLIYLPMVALLNISLCRNQKLSVELMPDVLATL